MIRKLSLFTLLVAGLSACASGKFGQKPLYEPARFTIEAVVVDSVTGERPKRGFLSKMRRSANHTRKAYNIELGDPAVVYNLELSLERLESDPTAISMTAFLRNPDDGVAVRTVPVTHQLTISNSGQITEEQLLREALPKAFNGVYGLVQTPVKVLPVLFSDQLFEDQKAARKAQSASARPKASAPASSVSVETQAEGEPKVITCAIC